MGWVGACFGGFGIAPPGVDATFGSAPKNKSNHQPAQQNCSTSPLEARP